MRAIHPGRDTSLACIRLRWVVLIAADAEGAYKRRIELVGELAIHAREQVAVRVERETNLAVS